MSEATKIIVKVGKSTDIVLQNVKAYRAITFKDVKRLLLSNPETEYIVIEQIKDSETDLAKDLIQTLKSDDKHVILYNKNNDDILNNMASNESISIVNSLEQLKEIVSGNSDNDTTNINIGNAKEELNEALSAIENNKKYTEVVEHPAIENKEDLELFEELNRLSHKPIEQENKTIDSLDAYKEKTTAELINILAEMEKEQQRIRERLSWSEDRIAVLVQAKEALEDEKEDYKNQYDRLKEEYDSLISGSDVIEEPISEESLNKLNDDLVESQRALESIKSKLNTKELELQTCQSELESCKIQLSEKETKMIKLQAQISDTEQLKITIARLEERCNIESSHRLKISEMMADAIEDNNALKVALRAKNIEIEEVKTSLQNSIDSLLDSNNKIQQLQEKCDELNKLLSENNQNVDSEKIRLQSELTVALDRCNALELELSAIRDSLNAKELELRTIQEINSITGDKSESIIETNRILEETNKTLLKNANFLKQELDDVKCKLTLAQKSVSNLEEVNKQLKSSLLAMSRGATSGSGRIKIECNYSGKALIIPVFGSGSYGITTTAISIIRKIKSGRVLFMDMDISNPKADGWFGKVPIIKELEEIKDPLRRTGFSALIDKGSDYVIKNEKLILQRIADSKNVHIDYFSGSYTPIDVTKILAVNFTEFMNYLGNTYDYIVADLGRFGSSELGDALIRLFSEISYKNVIVTLKDKIDVRAVGIRANDNKINLDRTIWILNMANDTKVDELITRIIGNSKMLIMPKIMQMYGSGKSYDQVAIAKDRLSELMEMLLD